METTEYSYKQTLLNLYRMSINKMLLNLTVKPEELATTRTFAVAGRYFHPSLSDMTRTHFLPWLHRRSY